MHPKKNRTNNKTKWKTKLQKKREKKTKKLKIISIICSYPCILFLLIARSSKIIPTTAGNRQPNNNLPNDQNYGIPTTTIVIIQINSQDFQTSKHLKLTESIDFYLLTFLTKRSNA